MFLAWVGLGGAIIILSLKSGLVLGMSRFKISQVILTSLIFGLSLGVMVMVFVPYQLILVGLLDEYTFLGSLMMAIFLIYLGLENQKGAQREKSQKTEGKILMAFLPCPLCLIALALTVIILAKNMLLSSVMLGWAISGVFAGLLIFISLIYRKLIAVFRVDHINILDSFLLILGVFTLCSGLFIPNFVSAMAAPFSPVVVGSGFWAVAVALGMGGISVIGYMRYNFIEKKGDR